MTRYSGVQIRDACAKAGFSTSAPPGGYSPADTMAAIALGESGGDDQATALTSQEHSVGVFQINLYAHTDITESLARDLNYSAAYSYRLSRQGTDFSPWTIYKNGSYRNFLPLPGVSGGSAPAPTASNPPQDTSGGTAVAGSILGIVPPSVQEWKDAGLIFLVALAGMFLVVVGVAAWTKEPIATVVKAAV
jgi:hypothetical protein